MTAEATQLEQEDWMIRDLKLATLADHLAQSCYLDYLVGELRQLYPDATNATEALISIAGLDEDNDITEVASVMAEVLIASQIVPIEIETFRPIAEFGTILPNQGRRHHLIGLPEKRKLAITLPDGWDAHQATARELRRRANVAGDIAIYFATGIGQQVEKRSPIFAAEAALSIKPFTDYEEQLDAMASQLEQFDNQNDEAMEMANRKPFTVSGPTDEEIRQSHIRAGFQKQLGWIMLGAAGLQQA